MGNNAPIKKLIRLTGLLHKNVIESDIIESGEIFECPYFKDKPFCTSPDLRETENKKCRCFRYKLTQK